MRRICIFLLFVMLLASPVHAAAPVSSHGAVLREAEAFLALLDQHRYAEAWGVGTRYFKAQLSAETWQQILTKHREPLGPVKARTNLSAKYIDTFDSAPPGLYLQVEFRTRFKRKTQLERLIFQKDTDGYWRISSYKLR